MKVNNYLYEAGVNEEVEMLEWHYEKAKSLGLVNRMALSNVSVGKSDVQKFQPDVEDYLFNGQDINDVIALVKRSIEREIQIKNDVRG